MKKLSLATALAAALASSMSAQAHSTNDTLEVEVNLTPQCILTTPKLILAYTSFQTSDATSTSNGTLKCTSGVQYELSINNAGGNQATTNLDYILSLSASATHNKTGATSIAAATATGNDENFYIHGTIEGNQGGQCIEDGGYVATVGGTGSAVCSNATHPNQHTVTVLF